MYCDEALDAVEAVAAGEVTPDGRLADHYATCPDCSTALASARELERLLHVRPAPKPSTQFTARTMTRVRRARWKSEQVLDVGFNVAIAVVVLAIAAGVWMLVDRTGVTSVSSEALDMMGRGFVSFAQRVAPSVPVYAGATALLVTALGIWWWAERDASF
jgi:roadblock/LC7 domain-containing protein